MKLPKRLHEILKQKETFLNEARTKLENSVLKLQLSLFQDIIESIIPELEIKNSLLTDSKKNYLLVSKLNKIYDTFNIKVIETLLPQINKGINTINTFTEDYYVLTFAELPRRFEEILRGTEVLTNLKIGLRQDKMIRGGLIMDMLNISPADFQNILSKAVTSQMSMKEFIGIIKENITGTEEKSGVLDRQFKRFAYDTYQQYDRAYNKKLSEEFNMKYFSYSGNLVIDSRDFCAAHYNKIWSKDEALDWETWTVNRGIKNGEFPEGYEIKTKEERRNAVPSYLGYPGYDPITDLGGYNCRHIYAPVPDELAFKLRPELKNII